MFAKASLGLAALATVGTASHLDDVNGFLSGFSFDTVKFKTKTDCSLDKYTSVSCWDDFGSRGDDTYGYRSGTLSMVMARTTRRCKSWLHQMVFRGSNCLKRALSLTRFMFSGTLWMS